MRGTRQAVLEALKERGRASVGELAEMVGVKPVTVRHHLNTLQADSLVRAEEERQPVGRPRHIYSLTEAGQSLFPQKYHLLAVRLLDRLKETMPNGEIRSFLRELARQVADETRAEIEHLPKEERVAHLMEVLEREGYMARWEQDGEVIRLTKHNCPYYFLGQRHPEICTIGETVIRLTLGADVAKSSCLLHGDACCTFELVSNGDRE